MVLTDHTAVWTETNSNMRCFAMVNRGGAQFTALLEQREVIRAISLQAPGSSVQVGVPFTV